MVIGALIGYLLLKTTVLKDSVAGKEIEALYIRKELYQDTSERLKAKESDLVQSNKQIMDLGARVATLHTEKENLLEKLTTLKVEIGDLHKKAKNSPARIRIT